MDPVNAVGKRATLLLAALLVTMIFSGSWLTWYSSTSAQRDQQWSEVTQAMEVSVLESQLAMAGWLAGDDEVVVESDVVGRLEDASQQCQALQNGGRTLDTDVRAMPALASDGQYDDLCAEIEQFQTLTESRLSAGADQQEGTPEDEMFDEAFASMMGDLNGLSATVNEDRRDNETLTQRAGYALVAVLGLLLAGIVFAGRRFSVKIARLARRNQVVLDAAGDGILGVDSAGVGTFANPAAASLTGRDMADLTRLDVHSLLHDGAGDEADHGAADCPIVLAFQGTGEGATKEDVFYRADGTSYPAEYTASPVRDDANTAGVIVFRDISDRRAVDALKDEFVSMVSHELRTPLTSIHGSLGLLSGGALGEMPPSAQRMLDIATTNTDRLVRLINDILDIERMESGAVRMEREVVAAAALVEQAVSSMRAMAAKAGVELVVDVEPLTIWADGDRITQVLVNLLSNAIKFSPEGAAVTATLRLDGEDALFTVGDEGRGIPAEKRETIFGRFQQVDASDSRDKGGTGLGLAISESIITQHDGRIWVESGEGQGSVFLVRIPGMHRHEETEDTPRRVRRDLPSRGGGKDSCPTVLVVDDDPSVLEVVCTILESRDYRAVPASSGEEALARALAEPPDAVVLDLIMPGTDGWQVLGRLRAEPTTADVPVVILSILSEREDSPEPSTYEGWVPKPFDTESLASVLERAIAHGSGQLRALVVEDDADLADVLITTFQGHGVDSRHVDTAAAARSLVPEMQPDLIVLDLKLPDGDGVELLHSLRAQGHLGGVPVVVYTGYDIAPADRSQLREDGAIIFTKTRVSPDEFEQRVLQLVGALVLPRVP
ncbi:MAG TPA: response regulator [Ornithinimicrobium sp.]|uniref:response regulator n=1 Tax=Ornithinimicrobium sp. TaxID=1977084 RepID=UPI002B48935A|nr:response regulator [Ornithinimicrobium sp.]HKJ11377.1 response regulator [Ornithinimicrobium sp.]